jgi:hypothetical protein
MMKCVLLCLGVIEGIIPSKMELTLMLLIRVCEPSQSQVLPTASLYQLENKPQSIFLITQMNVENSMKKLTSPISSYSFH